MLETAEDIQPIGGRIEGAFFDPAGWTAMPCEPSILQLRLFLGDPVSGPLVWLFLGSPVDPACLAGRKRPHLHRSPSFRIALGEHPRQMLLNNRWCGNGDYFLLDANKVYTDPMGVEGFQTLLVYSDRRGMHPVSGAAAGMSSDDMLGENARKFGPFGDALGALHTANEQAVPGAAITTHDELQHGSLARGSLHDRSGWAGLSDGSAVAAIFMGDEVAGPAVILSQNAPNSVESFAGRCGTDMLRVVAKGDCSIGGRQYRAGSFVALEKGARIGRVEHGPEGSAQLLIVSDRRVWAPLDEGGLPALCRRMEEVAGILAPYVGDPVHGHGPS